MAKETSAGSWIGDLTNEWKQAKTPERVFIVGVVIAVIGIALYIHNKNSVSQPGANNQFGVPANFQQGTGGGGGNNQGQPGAPGAPGAPGKPGAPGAPGAPGKKYTPPVHQPTHVTKVYSGTTHGGTQKPPSRFVQPINRAPIYRASRPGILQPTYRYTPPPGNRQGQHPQVYQIPFTGSNYQRAYQPNYNQWPSNPPPKGQYNGPQIGHGF